jgi:hypothetical protein
MIPLHPQDRVNTSSIETVELRKEAIFIATYLFKRHPKEDVINRYIAGVNIVLNQPLNLPDEKIQSFIRLHPKSLPYLDAASAILYPKRLLRNKILLMVAILETTPDYCDEFFTTPFSKGKFVLEIIFIAIKTSFQVGIGVCLSTMIRMKRQ